MIHYTINYILLLFYLIIDSFEKNKTREYGNKNLLTKVAMFQLFLLSALRASNVGVDLKRYIPRFEYISSQNISSLLLVSKKTDFEFGFVLLNKAISIISKNQQIYLAITSMIIMYSFSRFILKLSKIPLLSVLIFMSLGFWSGSMNILRQYLAL